MLLATLLGAGPVVGAAGGADCPTATEVAERVAHLLTSDGPTRAPDVVAISDDGGRVRVTLRDAAAGVIGERVFEGPGKFACADLAAAAAVVVATWESDIHPEFTLQLPGGSAPRAAAPAPGSFDLGAALFGSIAPTSDAAGVAPGLALVAVWTPRGVGPGLRLALLATTERALPLAGGQLNWRLPAAAIGLDWRWAAGEGAWAPHAHVDALAGWAFLQGVGFMNNFHSGGFEPGAGFGLRLLRRGGWLSPWADLSAVYWLRRQVALEMASGQTRQLPRVEGILSVGASFAGGP